MPISSNSLKDPFLQVTETFKINIPQARVLSVLMPARPEDPPTEWPFITRGRLQELAGFTVKSGGLTRVLNGIRAGNRTSGTPHPGLIERGLIAVEMLDIDGLTEYNYRITATGIQALKNYFARGGKLPEKRDASTYTNRRYLA